MGLRSYKKVLWTMLALGISSLYMERIMFYRRLRPVLNPTSDSISIPLAAEGALLICTLLLLSGVQYLLGIKLERKGITRIKNAYSQGEASRLVRGIMFLWMVAAMALGGMLLLDEFSLVSVDIFRACSLLPAVFYSALLANYWGNTVSLL